jgi:hypothetical protein
MAQAQGSRHSVAYVAESTFGTTPGTPSMLELRNTGATLRVTKDNFVSEEIRNDRQIVDLRHGLVQVAGDINFEMIYGAYDDFLEAALFGTWATNVLKAGVTPKFFSIERAFADVSEYHLFAGCMVNTMSLNIQPNSIITGSFGIIGKNVTVGSSAADASVTAAVAHQPFDGFSGTISEGGSTVDNITSLTIELNNNLNPAFVIGLESTPQILAGRSIVTGTVSAFFESEALLNKFLNETESSISVFLDGAEGGDLTILIPRIKYTAADVDVTAADDGILINLPFQAMRDSSEATNLKITRTPA